MHVCTLLYVYYSLLCKSQVGTHNCPHATGHNRVKNKISNKKSFPPANCSRLWEKHSTYTVCLNNIYPPASKYIKIEYTYNMMNIQYSTSSESSRYTLTTSSKHSPILFLYALGRWFHRNIELSVARCVRKNWWRNDSAVPVVDSIHWLGFAEPMWFAPFSNQLWTSTEQHPNKPRVLGNRHI